MATFSYWWVEVGMEELVSHQKLVEVEGVEIFGVVGVVYASAYVVVVLLRLMRVKEVENLLELGRTQERDKGVAVHLRIVEHGLPIDMFYSIHHNLAMRRSIKPQSFHLRTAYKSSTNCLFQKVPATA